MISSHSTPIGKPARVVKKAAKVGRRGKGKELKETVNNLYWVESIKLPCLWYGVVNGESKSSLVTVAVIGRQSSEASSSLALERYQLQPLEYRHLSRCQDSRIGGRSPAHPMIHAFVIYLLLLDFTGALMDFAEWDDRFRDSYWWPAFISDLIHSPARLKEWLDAADNHNIATRIKVRRKLYLFLLSANFLGIEDEYMVTSEGEFYTDLTKELLEWIAKIEISDKATIGLVPRTSSRASDQWQVTALPQVDDSLKDQTKDLKSADIFNQRYERIYPQIESRYSFYQGQPIMCPKATKSENGAANSQYALCIILKIEDFKVPIDDDVIVVDDSDNSSDPIPVELRFQVYDGVRRWTVPASSCKIPTSAIEEYVVKVMETLSWKSETLNASKIFQRVPRTLWSAREFDLFMSGLKK